MNPVLTVEPYNPIPNMFIPHKYRNIIPKDPIYDNKAEKRAKWAREEHIRMNKGFRERAKLYGTSFNRIARREAANFQFTHLSDSFDAFMKDYTDAYQNAIDQQAKDEIHKKIIEYTTWFPNRARGSYKSISITIIPTGASADTSDDTIELEKRPNK
ncbi:unnamed protein product [Rhizophagus irregularis]|nr:unnamed protein product [Rhizophagus irregularis]